MTIEPKEGGNYKLDDKIVLKCRATMRTLHKTPSLHLIHQRQSKSSILWYKENEILKSSVRRTTATADDEPSSSSQDQETSASNNDENQQHKIEIETKLDNNEQTLNSILTISHARETDSGKYRCIYDNIQENVQIRVINDRKLIFVCLFRVKNFKLNYFLFIFRLRIQEILVIGERGGRYNHNHNEHSSIDDDFPNFI